MARKITFVVASTLILALFIAGGKKKKTHGTNILLYL
jgi:hypothetical protein